MAGKAKFPANKRRWTNAVLMLAHCLRRWSDIKPTLVQHIVFAASSYCLLAFQSSTGKLAIQAVIYLSRQSMFMVIHQVVILHSIAQKMRDIDQCCNTVGPASVDWHCYNINWVDVLCLLGGFTYYAVQSQKALTSYFPSKQLLPFRLQSTITCCWWRNTYSRWC